MFHVSVLRTLFVFIHKLASVVFFVILVIGLFKIRFELILVRFGVIVWPNLMCIIDLAVTAILKPLDELFWSINPRGNKVAYWWTLKPSWFGAQLTFLKLKSKSNKSHSKIQLKLAVEIQVLFACNYYALQIEGMLFWAFLKELFLCIYVKCE